MDEAGKGSQRVGLRKHFRRSQYGGCNIGNNCEIGLAPRRKIRQPSG
jgi:hypothetical protein